MIAAVALPTWFPPIKMGPRYYQESLTSGALGFSNPAKQALDEARQIFGSDTKASIILSIGSGRRHPRSLNGAMVDVLDDMGHSGDQIAEELTQRFNNTNIYQRFSVDSGLESLSTKDWTEENLGAITSHSKTYIKRVVSSLSTTAEALMKNEGSVTLGQLSEPLMLHSNSY
jgi:hypothetical protein